MAFGIDSNPNKYQINNKIRNYPFTHSEYDHWYAKPYLPYMYDYLCFSQVITFTNGDESKLILESYVDFCHQDIRSVYFEISQPHA